MKRRTLDIAFSVGGVIVAVALFVLGFVLKQQADFATEYVDRELSAQQISFPETYDRGETEVAGSDCLVGFAGQALNTGAEAECYARYYIATHMMHSATDAGFEGATYASLGGPVGEARTALADAKEGGDEDAIAEAQAAFDKVNGLRETMFKGETLRGLLLTVYGFSVFGEKAEVAMWVCWVAAIAIMVLSIAGFVHAFASKKADNVILAVEHHEHDKDMAQV
ncbi:MAG: hypothetical protein HY828_09995 [Actinobacteria bacterium]|nr:hypothetical protein [Actinomycetota bacterium]